jgi:hypothetical protein
MTDIEVNIPDIPKSEVCTTVTRALEDNASKIEIIDNDDGTDTYTVSWIVPD